jgi:hypothetical protein
MSPFLDKLMRCCGARAARGLLVALCLALLLSAVGVVARQAAPATVEVSPASLRLGVGVNEGLPATMRHAADDTARAAQLCPSRDAARRCSTVVDHPAPEPVGASGWIDINC